MVNDLFGGLMKGLSGFMPQNDPETKIFYAQSELNDLQKQETEIFAEIGKQAYDQNPDSYTQADRLRLLHNNIISLEQKLAIMHQEKEAAQITKQAEEAKDRCCNCGHLNPQGTKFCQECGVKLSGSSKTACSSCGAQIDPETRFCGECGAKQEE